MKISLILITIGISLVGYSMTMEPFTDLEIFMEKYMAMSNGQSDDFYTLREEMLTSKYRLQDLGISIILFTVAFMSLLKIGGNKICSPNKKSTIIVLAILLPIISVSGFIFDLFQALNRNEFPYWADSLGIPLMGVPIQFGVLMLWSLAHLSLIKNISATPLLQAVSFKLNLWIMFISVITVLLVLLTAYYGQYWYSIPGLMWLYFYLSIGVSRFKYENT